MSDVSPVAFIFFVSIMLVPTGPYVWKETAYKRTGIIMMIVGTAGTIGVGIAVFWNLLHFLPQSILDFRISPIVPFIIVSLAFAIAVGFAVIRAGRSGFYEAFRDVSLICVAMWFGTRVLVPWIMTNAPPKTIAVSATIAARGGVSASSISTLAPVATHRLSHEQRTNLTKSLDDSPDISSKVWAFAYTSCNYCPRYAWDFAGAMNSVPSWTGNKHITVTSRVDNISVDMHGVIIGVPSRFVRQRNFSSTVLALAFDEAHIPYSFSYGWEQAPFNLPPDNVILLIMPND